VSYLHELDALEDFSSEHPHRADSPEFRASVLALGDGMPDAHPADDEEEGQRPLLLMSPQFDPDNLPDEMFKPDIPASAHSQVSPLHSALFLLGMSLLGATSAAAVFHDRLFRILGW